MKQSKRAARIKNKHNKQNAKIEKKQKNKDVKIIKKEKRETKKSSRSKLSVLVKNIFISSIMLVIAVILFLIVYLLLKFSKLDTVTIDPGELSINKEVEEANFGEGYFNMAIFGVDSRSGELEEGTLADTIMVVSLNNVTKEVRIVSVYRDTLLNLGNGSYNKCNTAYSIGGPAQAISMLNSNLDLNIEKYVSVDFSILVDLIDTMGGIELEIDDYEIDGINAYIPETARVAGVEANLINGSGLQLVDGAQATTYARIRSTAGGDFRRTDRQRYVIEQLVKKLKKSNIFTINSLIDLVLPRISTNFTVGEVAYYAAAYLDFNLGSTTGFPEMVSTGKVPGLGSVVVPETLSSNVSDLHLFLFEDSEYEASSVVLSNSYSISSIASSYTGGVANSNTGYTTNSSTNVSNLGISFTDIIEAKSEEKFDNPEITFK